MTWILLGVLLLVASAAAWTWWVLRDVPAPKPAGLRLVTIDVVPDRARPAAAWRIEITTLPAAAERQAERSAG